MPKITPFLWFDGPVEDAVNFYLSIFKDGKLIGSSSQKGRMITATFEIEGQQLLIYGEAPVKFNESISLFVSCKTQEEVDYYWDKLTAAGVKSRCGWLKDKFGLWWQIIPDSLGKMLQDNDREKANRVMQAMLRMDKIEMAVLQTAYDNP